MGYFDQHKEAFIEHVYMAFKCFIHIAVLVLFVRRLPTLLKFKIQHVNVLKGVSAEIFAGF